MGKDKELSIALPLSILALHLIQAIKTSLQILEVLVFSAVAASFDQFFFLGHGEDVPFKFQGAKS